MAEISYPFAAASAGGGSEMVSQVEWQNMSHLWGSDRIDFQLTNVSYAATSLPLFSSIEGSDLVVQPGSAWVGGFYYKLDAPLTRTAPTNSESRARIDTVMLRADMAAGSVNIVVVPGQPAAVPVAPTPQRSVGGIWEMPLWDINLLPNNGSRTLSDRRRFDGPGMVRAPWNASLVSESLPSGNFVIDMDSNTNGYQHEAFRGRDGYGVTRHLGKRTAYTPDLFTVTNKPSAANRKGWWRYIAPGTVQFDIQINNTSTKAVEASGAESWVIGFTLPVSATRNNRVVLHGFLDNPERRNGLDNFVDIKVRGSASGNTSAYLFYPNLAKPDGLDGLKLIPGKSELLVSGVYETNDFD